MRLGILASEPKESGFGMKKLSIGIAVVLVALLGFQPVAAMSEEIAPTPGPRIIGGTTASIRQVPWQVALIYSPLPGDWQFCGGSILSSVWVLTAAHCVEDFAAEDLDVLAGKSQLSELSPSPERVMVSEIIIHPNYFPGPDPDAYDWRHDIALLRLSSPLNLTSRSGARAIALPGTAVKTGASARISGWGDTVSDPDVTSYPSNLRYADLRILADSACENVYGTDTYEASLMVCAGVSEFSIDTCQGDSGGPLATRISNTWYLHGVTSFGAGCAQDPFPGVYTEVFAHRDWIVSEIWAEPSITEMSPSIAPRGAPVVITGTGLSGITSVRVGSTSATFSIDSDSQITFFVPSRANSGDFVTVSNPAHNVSYGPLTIVAPPKINSVQPRSISVGTRVTVTGSGFVEGGTTVTIGGRGWSLPLSDVTVSASQITGVIPVGARTGSLVVTTAYGSDNRKVTIKNLRR